MHEQDTTPDPADLITTSEAAKLVRCHLSCIYRWVLSGRLRAWKWGGRRRVSRKELLALLEPVGRWAEPPPAPRPRRQQGPSKESLEILRRAGFKV